MISLPVRSFAGGVIRIAGHIIHKTGSLYPAKGKQPFYNHFYIYNGQEAVTNRTASLLYDVNLSKTTTEIIQRTMDFYNYFGQCYKHQQEVEEEQALAEAEGRSSREYYMSLYDNRPNSRKINKPLHNEVAAIFTSDDGAQPKRDFIVISRDDKLQLLCVILAL